MRLQNFHDADDLIVKTEGGSSLSRPSLITANGSKSVFPNLFDFHQTHPTTLRQSLSVRTPTLSPLSILKFKLEREPRGFSTLSDPPHGVLP